MSCLVWSGLDLPCIVLYYKAKKDKTTAEQGKARKSQDKIRQDHTRDQKRERSVIPIDWIPGEDNLDDL